MGPDDPEFQRKLGEHLAAIVETEKSLAHAIGRVVINLNALEERLSLCLAYLLNLPELGAENYVDTVATLNACMSFGQKLDLLCELYLKRTDQDEDLQGVFSKFCTDLSMFEEYRNKVVHSFWHPDYHMHEGSAYNRFKATLKGRKGSRLVKEKFDTDTIKLQLESMVRQMNLFLINEFSLLHAVCRTDSIVSDNFKEIWLTTRAERLRDWPFAEWRPPS